MKTIIYLLTILTLSHSVTTKNIIERIFLNDILNQTMILNNTNTSYLDSSIINKQKFKEETLDIKHISSFDILEEMKTNKDQQNNKILYLNLLIFSVSLVSINYLSLSITYNTYPINYIKHANLAFMVYFILSLVILNSPENGSEYYNRILCSLDFLIILYNHIVILVFSLFILMIKYNKDKSSTHIHLLTNKILYHTHLILILLLLVLSFSNIISTTKTFKGIGYQNNSIILFEISSLLFILLLHMVISLLLLFKIKNIKLLFFQLFWIIPSLIDNYVRLQKYLLSKDYRYQEYFSFHDLTTIYHSCLLSIFYIANRRVCDSWWKIVSNKYKSDEYITDEEIRDFLILRNALRKLVLNKTSIEERGTTIDYCNKINLDHSFLYHSFCEDNSFCESDCSNKSITI